MVSEIDKKRSIGEVAKELGIAAHIIRFWELKFPQIKPEIGKGKRRYYFNHNIAVLSKIKSLLYEEGYTIAGLQKLLRTKKKGSKKENNLQFLLENTPDLSDDQNNKITVSDLKDDLSSDQKIVIRQIINKIELSLKNLQ